MKKNSFFSRLFSPKESSNVIQLSKYKNKPKTNLESNHQGNEPLSTATQKCTYCKQAARLTFYASDEGIVVGVCKSCKHKAEKQDMLPI